MSENNVSPTGGSENSNDKLFGILAYVGILVLVPIFAAKDSQFARFHANQGLVLVLSTIAMYIVAFILAIILALVFWPLAFIPYLAAFVAWAVLAIMGIVNVVKMEMKPLPVIGKFTLLK